MINRWNDNTEKKHFYVSRSETFPLRSRIVTIERTKGGILFGCVTFLTISMPLMQ